MHPHRYCHGALETGWTKLWLRFLSCLKRIIDLRSRFSTSLVDSYLIVVIKLLNNSIEENET